MMILALDPATITGWAKAEPGGNPVWGSARMGQTGCDLGEACDALWQLLHEHGRPAHIVYEQPWVPQPRQPKFTAAGMSLAAPQPYIPMNADTLRKLIGFEAVINLYCHRLGIDCRSVTPMQATKYLTGKGSFRGDRAAKKAATVTFCQRYGWDVKNDNEADALAILLVGEAHLYPQDAMRRNWGPLSQRGRL